LIVDHGVLQHRRQVAIFCFHLRVGYLIGKRLQFEQKLVKQLNRLIYAEPHNNLIDIFETKSNLTQQKPELAAFYLLRFAYIVEHHSNFGFLLQNLDQNLPDGPLARLKLLFQVEVEVSV
jgi:hypothetical protein